MSTESTLMMMMMSVILGLMKTPGVSLIFLRWDSKEETSQDLHSFTKTERLTEYCTVLNRLNGDGGVKLIEHFGYNNNQYLESNECVLETLLVFP